MCSCRKHVHSYQSQPCFQGTKISLIQHKLSVCQLRSFRDPAEEVWGDALQTDSPTAHRPTTDGVHLTRGHTLPVGSVAPIGSFKEVRPCLAGCK